MHPFWGSFDLLNIWISPYFTLSLYTGEGRWGSNRVFAWGPGFASDGPSCYVWPRKVTQLPAWDARCLPWVQEELLHSQSHSNKVTWLILSWRREGRRWRGKAGDQDKITPSFPPSLSRPNSPPHPMLNQTFPTHLLHHRVLPKPVTRAVGSPQPQCPHPLTSTFCLTSSRLARRWLSVFWAYSMWLQYLP